MKLENLVLLITLIFIALVSFWRLTPVETFIFASTLGLLIQGAFATYAMLFSFFKPEDTYKVVPPRVIMGGAQNKFTLIVPAKNEEEVIGDTIWAMANLDYPVDKYEVLVVVRDEDSSTKQEVEQVIQETGRDNIRLIKIDGFPINKSYSLNMALHYATGDIVGVFDAEDQPHTEILKSVDEVFINEKTDIVQAGVQLINVSHKWFSPLNCLEYYFWFKSILPFFSKQGATPLGGNTVFLKRKVLDQLNGWDENCLTEDADIGVRASAAGFKTKMIYLEEMATLEETPINELAFIKQRTRWDQGFLQILLKGDWLKLKTLKQQLLSLYVLIQPLIHQFTFITMLAIPLLTVAAKVRVWLALFSFFPLYFFLLQFGLYFIGLWDLKKHYNLSFSKALYLYLPLFFLPYQFLLAVSFLRAVGRMIVGAEDWEKTMHLNTHRAEV